MPRPIARPTQARRWPGGSCVLLPALRMFTVASELGDVLRFLTVFAAVLAESTTWTNLAAATSVRALLCLSHDGPLFPACCSLVAGRSNQRAAASSSATSALPPPKQLPGHFLTNLDNSVCL